MRGRIIGILLCFVTALPLWAQSDHAALNGTIMDSSGAIVPAVKVEALSLETGLRRQTVSSETGTYVLPGLPIGGYKITFTKEGFRPISIDRVLLSVGETRT